jgi:hypothetical protein
MATIQYTIRNVPSSLDGRLKKLAKSHNSSLNSFVIEQLSRSVGMQNDKKPNRELDWFLGSSDKADQIKFRETVRKARIVTEKDWQ